MPYEIFILKSNSCCGLINKHYIISSKINVRKFKLFTQSYLYDVVK